MDIEIIRTALKEELARHLAPVPLDDLVTTEGLDHDGEPVLWLQAVYDDAVGTPTDAQAFEAIGVVADRLDILKEPRFPLLSFTARSEHRSEAA